MELSASKCKRRGLLVLISWTWMFLGAFIISMIISYIVKGSWVTDIDSLFNLLYERPYLASYIELTAIGGLQLAISLFCKDNFSAYGLRKGNTLWSLILAVIPVAVFLSLRLIQGSGMVYTHFGLSFPLNLFYALLAVPVYGPLEVFFVMWLIVNTDEALRCYSRRILSPGLLITVTVFGFSHLILSPKGGILNAVKVTVEFLILGLIFKYTKNSIGPMIAWTLINHQVLYQVMGCLM